MKLRTPAYIFIPLTLISITFAFMMILPNDNIMARGFGGMMSNFFNALGVVFKSGFYWGVMAVSVIMLLIIDNLNKMVESGKFKKLSEADQKEYLAKKEAGYLKTLWKSRSEKQSEEEEKAIILDHGFDGIVELDNSLPQWWLALFYFGCAFMVVYLLAYSFTDFAHPDVEYAEETDVLEEQFAGWIKANDINIDGAMNLHSDEAAVQRGKEKFELICATCHTATGGGASGPNLTDDYWINQLQDSLYYNIYNVVYDGSPNNPAMVAFGQTGQLTGLDIQDVASYVYKLNMDEDKNVTPEDGGLAPQGTVAPWYGNADGTNSNSANESESNEEVSEEVNTEEEVEEESNITKENHTEKE